MLLPFCSPAAKLRAAAFLAAVATLPLVAQAPMPLGEGYGIEHLLEAGEQALEAEDPLASWGAFQQAVAAAPARVEGRLGLGRAHLLLGRARPALANAEQALAASPSLEGAMALAVRARIRDRQFDAALRYAEACVQQAGATASGDLLAAQASALFRVQRTMDAGAVYRLALLREPLLAEAHLRLGSGLLAPREVTITTALQGAVTAMRAGRFQDAILALQEELGLDGGNPVAHRLLGEALLQRRTLASMAMRDPAYAHLRSLLAAAAPDAQLVEDFMPAYRHLDGERREVVDRAMQLFGSRLSRLIAIGGRHDLLLETDRTTDAEGRAMLKGKRTFDGRVWDDVRGIGGLSAATGIEALDEAAQFGFDTLAHELAHQVHYFALRPVDRAKITELYKKAKREGRCLDYYAASDEAEYFGQGVEAFHSLGKRPGGETTHGHTRFELLRVDPDLHGFVAEVVDQDPLAGPRRIELLLAAIDVALRCGRPDDAVQAAEMLPAGAQRDEARVRAAAALQAAAAW